MNENDTNTASWVNAEDWPTCSHCGCEAPIDRGEYEYRGKIRPETSNYCPNCGFKMN